MMKKVILYSIISLISVGLKAQSNTPCSGGTPTAPNINVGAGCTYQSGTTVGATQQTNANNGGTPSCGSMGEDVWYSFVAPASGSVQVETTAGSITDGVMAIYSGTCGSFTELGCDDDSGPGLMPSLGVGGLTPGVTYFIRFWDFGGGTGTFNMCVTEASIPPPATNTTCTVPNPICSGSPIVFTANSGGADADVVNPGNDYDCLFTSPNPSWYYLEIDNPGNLVIDITAGSDIDYEIWGPFPNLANAVANCNSYGVPQDCSYSFSATEQAVVNGVASGEVYVLLVTNYANVVQTITINEAAANTASTNCAIVTLPVELAFFEGENNGGRVNLTWTTLSETNCDYFVIERSENGIEWSSFGLIDGHGTTSEKNEYSITDSNPFDGQNYYRLKQFDVNGSIYTSDVISVSDAKFNELVLYPNPAQDRLKIYSNEFFTEITIVDIRGNSIIHETFDSIKQAELSLETMKNGVYFVQIAGKNGQVTERLVVQK